MNNIDFINNINSTIIADSTVNIKSILWDYLKTRIINCRNKNNIKLSIMDLKLANKF